MSPKLGKNTGVHTQTKGGPPADVPAGPWGPWGPAGPCGPVTFHSTRDSLLWQAVLASTRRIIPLPGLMQASSTDEGPAATFFTTTTSKRVMTTEPRETAPKRRTNVLRIQFLLRAKPPAIVKDFCATL